MYFAYSAAIEIYFETKKLVPVVANPSNVTYFQLEPNFRLVFAVSCTTVHVCETSAPFLTVMLSFSCAHICENVVIFKSMIV